MSSSFNIMTDISSLKKLPRKFYVRNVLTVAGSLPGNILVRKKGKKLYAGRIVEVEAYDGAIDEAAHSFKGKTKRNEVMFGQGGCLYVYFTYGSHFCCNVVTGKKGEGAAVLIRALEPIKGIKHMSINRYSTDLLNEKKKYNLTSGPGKVCKAIEINSSDNCIDLTGDKIFILAAGLKPGEEIITSTRIGITRSVELPWRFFIKDNPFVSRK